MSMANTLALFFVVTGVICMVASAVNVGLFLWVCAPVAWFALR